MARVRTAVARHIFRQLLDLFRRGVATRYVEGAGGEPPGSLLHPRDHERAHPLEFGRCGVPVLRAHHLAANRPVRHELSHVHPQPICEECLPLCGLIDWTASIRIHEDRRQSHSEEWLGVTQLGCRQTGACMRVHIDETRRDVEARGIDDTIRPDVRCVTDPDDSVALNHDIGVHPWIARTVQHAPVPDYRD